MRRSTLKKIIEDAEESEKTKHKAQSVLKIKARPEEFLAFVQSGSILSVVFAATFAGFFAVDDLSPILLDSFGFQIRPVLLFLLLSQRSFLPGYFLLSED